MEIGAIFFGLASAVYAGMAAASDRKGGKFLLTFNSVIFGLLAIREMLKLAPVA